MPGTNETGLPPVGIKGDQWQDMDVAGKEEGSLRCQLQIAPKSKQLDLSGNPGFTQSHYGFSE